MFEFMMSIFKGIIRYMWVCDTHNRKCFILDGCQVDANDTVCALWCIQQCLVYDIISQVST